MRLLLFFIILTSASGLFAQDENEYFVEDSFQVSEFPVGDYYEVIFSGLNTSTYWNMVDRNGSLFFYDDYYSEFEGDSLPYPVDTLRNISNCRIRWGHYQILKMNDGWLIGVNQGEWGGSLYRFSPDLKECEIVCNGNINQLYTFEDRVLALEGLSHLSSKTGNILEINNDLTIDTLLTLDETPYSITLDQSKKGFLLTNSRIYSINSEMDTSRIYSNETWTYLYAGNLIRVDNNLYITMKGGIAKYFIKEKELKWLTRE